jgi:hypothetical protein
VRVFLFVVAFAIGLALYAPLERWLVPYARRSVPPGTDVTVDSIRIALPAGVRAKALNVDAGAAGVRIDSLYFGLSRAFDAEACGGQVTGRVGGGAIRIDLAGIDPSRCLRAGKLELESVLDGSITLDRIDLADLTSLASGRASVDVHSPGGVFRGVLE